MLGHFRFLLAIVVISQIGCDRVKDLSKSLKKTGEKASAQVAEKIAPTTAKIDASGYQAFIAQKDKLVIVDFYADWCGPCKQLSPVLEKAVKKHSDVVVLGKIDIDKEPRLADQEKVSGIPDVRIYKNGIIVANFVGFPGEPAVMAKIDALAKEITPPMEDSQASTPKTASSPAPQKEAVQPMKKDWLPPGVEKR